MPNTFDTVWPSELIHFVGKELVSPGPTSHSFVKNTVRHGPHGWHCSTHDQATLVYPAPGQAIASAWNAAEPDHERLSKLNRQFYQISMRLEL